MKQELDEALVRDFPLLYASRNAPMTQTCMCWGFSTPDSWEPVIRKLSEKLEKMILELPKDQREYCMASQVKEKFGELRFYMTSSTEEMDMAIQEAETECWEICAGCGSRASITTKGWITRLCRECFKKKVRYSI